MCACVSHSEACSVVWTTLLATMHSVVRAVLVVPIITIIVLWMYHNWRYRRVRAAARTLPSTFPTLPFLGNLRQMIIRKFREEALLYFKEPKNDCATCIWVGPHPIFVLTQPEDIQAVISETKSTKSGQYDLLKFVLGEGLLTATDDIHAITRRYINPLFQPRNLQHLMPTFNESSRHFVHSLSEHVGRGIVDVEPSASKTALRNIACVIFGAEIKIKMNSEEFEGLQNLGPRIGRIFFKRLTKLWLWSDCVFKFLLRKQIEDIHHNWKQFAEGPLKIIERRAKLPGRKYSYDLGFQYKLNDEEKVPKNLTLPDTFRVLQEDHPGFPDEHLRHEMITLVMAGADTTKIAISSCLLALADNPDVQERTFQEISRIVGPSLRDVTVQDLQNMPYLDQVYKETLRKFCIIPFVMRKAKEDLKLRDCTVPVGATIIINLIGLHYNPNEFPEPDKFDPERFSPEKASSMKRFTYLPFSGGSRNCIGSQYAGMLVKTVVIHVLRRYRLTTSMDTNNLTFRMGIGLISAKGYKIQLHDRC